MLREMLVAEMKPGDVYFKPFAMSAYWVDNKTGNVRPAYGPDVQGTRYTILANDGKTLHVQHDMDGTEIHAPYEPSQRGLVRQGVYNV